jgi:uncharacterized protein (DUF924 family)
MKAQPILDFWFKELTPKQWFAKSDELDNTIAKRFSDTLNAAAKGALWHWREAPHGRLAEVIVLDQFSRNIYRGSPKAFGQDVIALVLAQEAVEKDADKSLDANEKAFLYMPYMHSESALIHEEAMRLFKQPGLENSYKFEVRHKEIIDQFGRYPHRNRVLGRESTPEEENFLKQPGSSL